MSEIQTEKIEKIYCNRCGQKTKHNVVAERIQEGFEDLRDEEYSVSWKVMYTMFECCGCCNITLRCRSWCSEWDGVEVKFYPPPIGRPLPRWHHKLPLELMALMEEVYTALQANSKRLALMGARALVDDFMNDKVGDIGGFNQKLEELEKQGLISKANRCFLDAALEAGHAVIHRGFNPKKETVEQVMDIVENLLQTYVLDEAADDLKKSIPERKKKSKTPSKRP